MCSAACTPAGSPSLSHRSGTRTLRSAAPAPHSSCRAAPPPAPPCATSSPWCAGPLAQRLPAPLRYQHLPEGVEVLNALARAEHDRLQRIVGQMDRDPCLFAQPLIEAAQHTSTAPRPHPPLPDAPAHPDPPPTHLRL